MSVRLSVRFSGTICNWQPFRGAIPTAAGRYRKTEALSAQSRGMNRPLAFAVVSFVATLVALLVLMQTALVAGGPSRALVLASVGGIGTYVAIRSGVLKS